MSSQRLDAIGRVVSQVPLGVYGGLSLPYPATYVCWAGPYIACQANLGVDAWQVIKIDPETGTIFPVSGPSSQVRAGYAAVLYQGNGCTATWADGAVKNYPDESYPLDVDDTRVICADGEKQRLTVYNQAGVIVRFPLIGGGLTSDDWDGPPANIVGDIILARTDTFRLYSAVTGKEIPIPVRNPMANYAVPYLTPAGRRMLLERQTVSPYGVKPEINRLTVRYADAHLGGVLAEGPMDFFGINARAVDGQAGVIWFKGINYTGLEQQRHALDFSDLPQVDVTTPPLIPPLPTPVPDMLHPLSVGWIFAFHHPGWAWRDEPWAPTPPGTPVSGTPFPDLDPQLPCDFVYPISYEELFYCIEKRIPCLAADEYEAQHLAANGLLWAFQVRNEAGNDLQAELDAIADLCVKYDRGVLVLNDRAFSDWPTRWTKYAVASIKLFYEQHESVEAFRQRARAIVAQFREAFPGVAVDLCPSAFDRNLTGWLPNELGNLQTVFTDLARELAPISLSPFNWGRGSADLTIGGAYQHPEIHQRWLALKPALVYGPSRYPRPSDFPPPPPEDTDMSPLFTWAAMEPELLFACYVAKMDPTRTRDETSIGKIRFAGFVPEGAWTPQHLIQHALSFRWTGITEADCVDPKTGQPLTVNQIIKSRT